MFVMMSFALDYRLTIHNLWHLLLSLNGISHNWYFRYRLTVYWCLRSINHCMNLKKPKKDDSITRLELQSDFI